MARQVRSPGPFGAPAFEELFAHRQLVEDLARTTSIHDFLRFLSGVRSTGRRLIQSCTREFLARNRLHGLFPEQATHKAEIAQIDAELQAHFDRFRRVGAAEEFSAYLRRFFATFPHLAAYQLDRTGQKKTPDRKLARTLHYLKTLNLFSTPRRRVLEFCAADGLFSLITGTAGHSVINTDVGGTAEEESYGFGAKSFLRSSFLGPNVLNFYLDETDFTTACAIPWFRDGVDVIAAHATHIVPGQFVGRRATPLEMRRSVSEVMRFLRPCAQALQKRHGILSLRHVALFNGYSHRTRANLSRLLNARIEMEFGASTVLCGEDPFPNPWAKESVQSGWGWQPDYALVIQF